VPFRYVNRQGKTYFLHSGRKRGGGIQYYLSTEAGGELSDEIPEGFEVYETVNGPVYLRKKRVVAITPEEIEVIERELKKRRDSNRYKIEVAAKAIVIHESTSKVGAADFHPMLSRKTLDEINGRLAHYMAVMRFVLIDKNERQFEPERYCFRGSVDDWISIGPPGPLSKLAVKYMKHLGKESLFELF
jgi:hypothetical protein